MAQIIGESGAYAEIRRKLAGVGLEIAALEDVARLRDELPLRRDAGVAGAAQEYDELARQYAARLAEWELYTAAVLAAGLPPYEAAAQAAIDGVRRAEWERNELGSFLSNIAHPSRWLRWFRARRGLAIAADVLRRANWALDNFRNAAELPVRQARATVEYHSTHRDEFLRDRVHRIHEQIALVNELVKHEVGGAVAELEVIALLAGLPEGWIVLNDVQLEYEQWIHRKGGNLKSAQLDHVAVGPGGVFLIETKNWSREFTASGGYFDPYQQTARASDLCYRMLKERGLTCRTRVVIATRSQLPKKPDDSFATVKRPEQVCGYLTWFKSELTPKEVVAISGFLATKVPPSTFR